MVTYIAIDRIWNTEKFISTCSMLDYKRIWNIRLDNLYGIIELL